MTSRVITLLLILALSIGSLACQKVDDRPLAVQTLATRDLTVLDSIPAEFGDLIVLLVAHLPLQPRQAGGQRGKHVVVEGRTYH